MNPKNMYVPHIDPTTTRQIVNILTIVEIEAYFITIEAGVKRDNDGSNRKEYEFGK